MKLSKMLLAAALCGSLTAWAKPNETTLNVSGMS